MTLGERIVEYRGRHNMTMSEFAEAARISMQTVRNIELNLQEPSRLTVSKIEGVIGKEGDNGHIGKQAENI